LSVFHSSLKAPAKRHFELTMGGRLKTFVLVAPKAISLIDIRGDLIRTVLARGHRVVCFAPAADDVWSMLTKWGAEVEDLPLDRRGLNPLADALYILRLWRRFHRMRPDVVMGYTPKPSIYAMIAAWLARVPRRVLLVTGLGFAFTETNYFTTVIVQGVARLLYWMGFRCATGVIFQNSDDRARLSGLAPSKLLLTVVNGSGIALKRFPQSPVPSPRGGLVFVLVARLVRYKGLLEYAQAARRLKRDHPSTRFVIVGIPEKGPGALTAKEQRNVRDSVEVIGPLTNEEVHGVLEFTHVFVLPSHGGEGVPRSALEALAVGRAIVTTKVAGCRETVQDGVNGFLVPARNAGALERAMRKFLDDPSLANRMGPESRRIAEKDFDVHIVNEHMIQALGL
jgi:glycosyltransferase involved in cell wall biosynthesis